MFIDLDKEKLKLLDDCISFRLFKLQEEAYGINFSIERMGRNLSTKIDSQDNRILTYRLKELKDIEEEQKQLTELQLYIVCHLYVNHNI